MTPSRRGTGLASAMAGVLVVWACTPGEPVGIADLEPPSGLTATPLNRQTVRLDWALPTGSAELQLLRIERRANLSGEFRLLAEVSPATTSYFDGNLAADTYYGFRVLTVDRLGERSRPSTVAGALTPPMPGLVLSTALQNTVPGAKDPNGYRVEIRGPIDTSVALGSEAQIVLSPLPVGSYTVLLRDVLSTCSFTSGDSVRTAAIADTGLVTRASVGFSLSCADPTRGRIVANVLVTGDSLDPDGYRLDYAGILPGGSPPAVGSAAIAGAGGVWNFPDLPPGDYQVLLGDVDTPCALSGSGSRSVQVAPLSLDTVAFAVVCPSKAGANPGAPFVLRNAWSPAQAGPGQTVTLDISVDMSAVAIQDVGSVQASLEYNVAVLSYLSGIAPAPSQMGSLTVNASTAGTLIWSNFTTAAVPPKGVVPVARFTFTVTGASGQSATRSVVTELVDGAGVVDLTSQIRAQEDTFMVGAGGGGGNQSPTAQAAGPYSGMVGSPINFSSAGSGDPDGTIAGYSWTFGDGTTSAQPNPAKPYASAGTYTATLMVTDNLGATATDQAAVTVTPASSSITWGSAFGAFNASLGTYPLVIALNLGQDIPQTGGAEAVASYVVDSLTWDPAVLEYHSLVYASGGGSNNVTNAIGGCKCKLVFSGVGMTPNTGMVALATVNLKPKGASGSTTTPRFHLGAVLSTPQLGSFNYLSVLQLVEGGITLP